MVGVGVDLAGQQGNRDDIHERAQQEKYLEETILTMEDFGMIKALKKQGSYIKNIAAESGGARKQ